MNYQIATLKRANNQPAVKGVKNIIAVTSGKGGVGKSSVSVNLALALQAQGARVGILDADIYGPSIPHMLGAPHQRPTSPDNQHITPIKAYGLSANSIGFLMDEDNATIWRGPMASSALSQLLNETLWDSLDYLVIDMPPGTGDIQLTLSQQIPVTGAVVVTTPQDIALLDAEENVLQLERNACNVEWKIENPILWNAEKPYLYTIKIKRNGEEIVQKTGMRSIAISEKSELLINGVPVKLHGVNHHDTDPKTG